MTMISWVRLSLVWFGFAFQFSLVHADTGILSDDEDVVYRTVQVQIVHRHGDRSPITPLLDEDYWASQLVPAEQLKELEQNYRVIRDASNAYNHNAGGRGVFGKLSELGLEQMVDVGLGLRKEFTSNEGDLLHTALFDPEQNPLSSDNVRVYSTDFPRTVQSVQGLVKGLFGQQDPDQPIDIDVRQTTMMIPDPQPRETVEQGQLEIALVNRPHILIREQQNLALAARATKALHHLLAPDAREAAFGVVQEHPEDVSIEEEPLAWNQLAELSKCLKVRNLLPEGISSDDVEEIGQHTAWRWFETLSHPRLIYLAMNEWVTTQVESMKRALDVSQPALTIWSCHDSSLIGMLCAYRLEKPQTWPEYSTVFLMEVVEVIRPNQPQDTHPELAVRFSINGERLRILWDPENPMDVIPLELLAQKIATETGEPFDARTFANEL